MAAPHVRKVLARYIDSWEVWLGSAGPEYTISEWADMQLHTVPQEVYDEFLEAIRP